MKRFEFYLIVGLALILGMCLFVPTSEANWAAAEADSGDADRVSSSAVSRADSGDADRVSSLAVSRADSDSDTNNASSSGFFADMWEILSGWFTSPDDGKDPSKKPTPRDDAPQVNPFPSQPGRG